MATTVFMTGVNKTGTMVTITVQDRKFPITFDMATGKYISYTGREVKGFPVAAVGTDGLSHIDKLLISATRSGKEALSKLELFLGQPDLLEDVPSLCSLPHECPKGFIKWVRENNKQLNDTSLREFKNLQALSSYSKEDKEIYAFLTTTENTPAYRISTNGKKLPDWYLSTTPDNRKIFNKIFKVSIKEFTWSLSTDMQYWVTIFTYPEFCCREGGKLVNPIQYVNTNRSFAWNNKMIVEMSKNKFETDILSKEDLIRPIETLSNDQFFVTVPSSLLDFTNEGEQQNNCVGYYYHDSIMEGENLIYFIRKANNPNKSYITNRFNIQAKRTVETRVKNNNNNNDKDALELIKRIDKMIRTLI